FSYKLPSSHSEKQVSFCQQLHSIAKCPYKQSVQICYQELTWLPSVNRPNFLQYPNSTSIWIDIFHQSLSCIVKQLPLESRHSLFEHLKFILYLNYCIEPTILIMLYT